MWITRRQHFAPDRARDRDNDLVPHDDDCLGPRNQPRRLDTGADGAVEPRMLMLVIVFGGRDGGCHLMNARGVVMIALMLLRAMVRLPMCQRAAGNGERDDQGEYAGRQAGSRGTRHDLKVIGCSASGSGRVHCSRQSARNGALSPGFAGHSTLGPGARGWRRSG